MLKVMVASVGIAIAIKSFAPLLPIPATTVTALVLVGLPPGVLALLLWQRTQQDEG